MLTQKKLQVIAKRSNAGIAFSLAFACCLLGNRIYHTWVFQVDLGLCFSEPSALVSRGFRSRRLNLRGDVALCALGAKPNAVKHF